MVEYQLPLIAFDVPYGGQIGDYIYIGKQGRVHLYHSDSTRHTISLKTILKGLEKIITEECQ